MKIDLTQMELAALFDLLDAKTPEETVLKIRKKIPENCQTAFRFHIGKKSLSLTIKEDTVVRLYTLLRSESPDVRDVKTEFKKSKLKLACSCPKLILALSTLKTKIKECFR